MNKWDKFLDWANSAPRKNLIDFMKETEGTADKIVYEKERRYVEGILESADRTRY